MPRHPLVAVTATTRLDDGVPRVRLSTTYLRALEAAGLTPIVIPPLGAGEVPADILDAVSGLVLTGGEDVAPARYGATPHPRLGRVHEERDATEIALVLGAQERRLPTLAICRGIQVVNVALGGTLFQDLPSERPSAIDHEIDGPRETRTHTVRITGDSRLHQAIGRSEILVNSIHHQSVDTPAPGLAVTAVAPDGVIEGVELAPDNPWWIIGIQWHPEDLVESADPWDRALFAAFGRAVSETATPRDS